MADDDVVVDVDEVKDDKAVVVDVSKPDKEKTEITSRADNGADKTSPEPDEGVAELRAQLDQIKQRSDRENAERTVADKRREQENRAVLEELNRLRSEQNDNRLDSILNALAAAKAEGDSAQKDYVSALEQGKVTEAAEAQRRMSRADARAEQLEHGKTALESEKRLPEGRVVRQEPEQKPNDFDSRISSFSPRTQNWLREHRECMTDQKMNNKMISAHYSVVGDGFIPDSDAYFDAVNKQLGFGEDNNASRVAVRGHNRAMPAAPVSRDSQNGTITNKVALNKREQEAADALGLSLTEYARRKQAMTREGWYDR